MRELKYADARKRKTPEAYEAFITKYSKGPDVATLKAELPAVHLSKLRVLLKEGADPNAVRIAGFEPAFEEKTSFGVISSTGKLGWIVPAKKEGMSLLEYCRELDQTPLPIF